MLYIMLYGWRLIIFFFDKCNFVVCGFLIKKKKFWILFVFLIFFKKIIYDIVYNEYMNIKINNFLFFNFICFIE